MTKFLIINADDFGMSYLFNESILELIRKDLVLSTTVMVNRITDNQKKQFEELIKLSTTKNVSIGLHLELKSELNYLVQIKQQYDKFKEILQMTPSHIDIHRAHSLIESFKDIANFCESKKIPLRNSGVIFENVCMTDSEAFFGSIEEFNKISEWISTFKDNNYYEILFHPGTYDKDCKSSLNKDRERDVKHIIKLNSVLKQNDIKVVSYFDLVKSK